LVLSGDLSANDHVTVIRSFGRVLPQGPRAFINDPPPNDQPLATLVSNSGDGTLGAFELLFHHDMAHMATPLSGLSLYAVDVAEGQAATRFADGAAAYRRLPDALKERLDRLQGLFVGNYTTITDNAVTARQARAVIDPDWPFAVHPVVVPHPMTGDRCVFVNEMQTLAVLGLSIDESDALLDELFAALYDPGNVYEHTWRDGQLVIWDNLAVQHARRRVDERRPRTLRRVVFGQRTPWEEWPARPPSSGGRQPARVLN
jgi:taurine dioxygenase